MESQIKVCDEKSPSSSPNEVCVSESETSQSYAAITPHQEKANSTVIK